MKKIENYWGINFPKNSLEVAALLNKNHKIILKDIKKLHFPKNGLCDENFCLSDYCIEKSNNKFVHKPFYEISRNGFVLLILTYTDPVSISVKIQFVNEFCRLEKQLSK
jgi:Rha family phage regulatory protein